MLKAYERFIHALCDYAQDMLGSEEYTGTLQGNLQGFARYYLTEIDGGLDEELVQKLVDGLYIAVQRYWRALQALKPAIEWHDDIDTAYTLVYKRAIAEVERFRRTALKAIKGVIDE